MTPNKNALPPIANVVCFSHLRWGFVFQRPQHLMSHFAQQSRVFFIEEPLYEDVAAPALKMRACPETGVYVVVPVLPHGASHAGIVDLLDKLIRDQNITEYVAWYYTPMAIEFELSVPPIVTIYDCMDELSLFRFAPPELHVNEGKLFDQCDLVFTGGVSLYEAKRERHPRVYAFPSSVDAKHFAKARLRSDTAVDQQDLPKPRLGYAGVIDERINLDLIGEVAARKPAWQFIMVGPVLKVDPASLPRHANIHWLGMKQYSELPEYFSGWDIATMPFALNESTLFISPTKTPEYLAAGLPVISTAIRDVVRTYGSQGLATIVSNADEFILAAEAILDKGLSGGNDLQLRQKADEYIGTLSWDKTWSAMNVLIQEVIASKKRTGQDLTVQLPVISGMSKRM